MEQRVIANISAARISLDAGIAECTTAETVFHAPQHPSAILNATKLLTATLTSLSSANLTATRKCSESTSEPILDNPFYMFAMAHLHMGRILCLSSLFGDALLQHFEVAVQVFPYSPRLFYALGNAKKSVAKSSADLEKVEHSFKEAVRISKDLAVKRDLFNEKMDKQKMDLDENVDEEDDDDDDDSWLLEASVDDEINAGRDAENALILLLIQLGRSNEAAPLLESGGYKYRLSDAVLAYSFAENSKGPWRLHDIPFVKAIDSALPDPALRYLQKAFARDSVFWKEHYYGPDTPYFSYSHALPTPNEKQTHPRSSMDQLIHYVHKLVTKLLPQVSEAKSAEWWVHSRVHSAGHQLHFDSAHEGKSGAATSGDNKTKKRRVGPVHPIASCVIYLSEGCGGPTMVTNQRLGDPLADRGWMVESRVNRLVVFDGSVLHGVIPGKGVCSDAGSDEGRRTSFMIAFWDHVDIKPSPDNTPGSGRPFPYDVNKAVYTWPQLHQPNTNENWPGAVPENLHHVIPAPLEGVWEAIGETVAEKESDAVQAILTEDDLELGYSKSRLGLPNYNLVFQGF
ncbi:hypothetical protein HDU81_008623 [Chytriomyces hyalinus]|nr:hypothetical protein HDU81_008623 [Chytriomyces hyalinus]